MDLRALPPLRALGVGTLLAALTLAATPVASAPLPSAPAAAAIGGDVAPVAPASTSPRAAVPEDRYAMAGGCYAVRSAATGRYVSRSDGAPAAVAGPRAKAEGFRFQATDLGRYLLFGTRKDVLAASEGAVGKAAKDVTDSGAGGAVGGLTVGETNDVARELRRSPVNTASGRGASVVLADGPTELADWKVTRASDGTFRFFLPVLGRVLASDEEGRLGLAESAGAGAAGRFLLERTTGCRQFPEVEVNVTGAVDTGETPYSEVSGYIDGHLHSMAFEFLGGRARCGRPWHPYGAPSALRGCKEHKLAGGRAAVLENFLSNRNPVEGHDTNAGWPTFTDWPKPNSLTYEQVYYKWLERAWRSGLRSYVNLLVDNNQLCKVYPYKKHGCNEMDGVRRQYQRIHEFQDYIDAQSGGPGEGWFRIVDDPFEARRVMNAGKLAVILGIEVSVLFDCGVQLGRPACSTEQIDERLDAVYDMGVRQMELVNKFDNGLSGVTGDSAAFGALVNAANFLETGGFWQMRTCEDPDTDAHDKEQYNFSDQTGAPREITGRDALVGVVLQEAGGSGRAPVYGPGPHCSDTGLSPLGAHLIERMMDRGMIFDPDHMSAKAREQAMDIIEARGYSGVVSSHSWADDTIYPRIWKAGGVVTPHAGTSASFIEDWRQQKAWADDRYLFGLGFGSDMNGFSTQGAARGEDAPNPVRYPFRGLGGVAVHKQVSGTKTFDFNVDGVAHYGMYADFVEDVRRLGGDQIVADMRRGAEAYLQMWERAAGVPEPACLVVDQVAQVRPGMTPEQVLVMLGQPAERTGTTFTFCIAGGTATVSFGEDGRVTGVDVTRAAPADRDVAGTAAATADGAKKAVAQADEATRAAPADRVKNAAAQGAGHDHAGHTHEQSGTVATSSRSRNAASATLLVLLVVGLVILARRKPVR